jgi:hypothetical protein
MEGIQRLMRLITTSDQRSEQAFRRLIDMAARSGGTYDLTYHRYARTGEIVSAVRALAAYGNERGSPVPDCRWGHVLPIDYTLTATQILAD